MSPQGTLLLAYMRQRNYDPDGNYRQGADYADRNVEVRVTRSVDGGLTWEMPVPLAEDTLRSGSPYGKIVACPDGALIMAIYHRPVAEISGAVRPDDPPGMSCSYLVRSHDDGRTWGDP
jgi:hypothetical protein